MRVDLDELTLRDANVDQRLAMLELLIRAYWTGNAEEKAIIRILQTTSLAQAGAMDLCVRSSGHSFDRHASIDDDIVVHHRRVVHDSSLPIHIADFTNRQRAMAKVVVREIVHSHEGEVIGSQAEVKVNSYSHAVKTPPGMDVEHRTRRQWRPAAVIARHTPGHPGRAPNAVRLPHPAATRMHLPASIMEWRPTP